MASASGALVRALCTRESIAMGCEQRRALRLVGTLLVGWGLVACGSDSKDDPEMSLYPGPGTTMTGFTGAGGTGTSTTTTGAGSTATGAGVTAGTSAGTATGTAGGMTTGIPMGAAGTGGTAGTSGATIEVVAGPEVDMTAEASGMAEDAGMETPAGGGAAGPSGIPAESNCLEEVSDYFGEGPFSYSEARAGSVKMWVPDVPAGCKVPVIHLANGTGGTCGSYQRVLNRFASQGFLTTCYESGQTGAGTQGVEAFEAALQMYPDLAAQALGSTGHSQGGQAAFTVLQQSEAKWGDSYRYAGLAMEPASGFGAQPRGESWQSMYSKIKSPMFMFSGTADTLVSARWVQQGFDALDDSIEAYNWSARGATHIPTPQEETMEVGVPWFRWKLLNDQAACKAFKDLTNGMRWSVSDEQNPESCM